MEKYGIRLSPISSGASCFLEVGLKRTWEVCMDDKSDVGFVYTHTESIGSYHHPDFIVLPVVLSLLFYGGL